MSKILLQILIFIFIGGTAMATQNDKIIYDFTKEQDFEEWQVINDTVMGGISQSRMEKCGKGLVCFTGTVSLKNNGGFCSASSRPARTYDLSNFEGIKIRLKGDGKRYKATLKNDTSFSGFVYQFEFKTEAGKWIDIIAPFNKFIPVFRGVIQDSADKFDNGKIKTFGFIIADKQAGEFRLEVDNIMAY
jgi:NADH dehydrogenase [ubiquinone] 1 alpha subcomplex assembly factor 1